MTYKETYDSWLKSPYVTNEDKIVLEQMTDDQIYEAFYKTAEFGTGGMRGIMGLGTNCLNIYTIRMATKALADKINSDRTVPEKEGFFNRLIAKINAGSGQKSEAGRNYNEIPKVVIAYDTRNNSRIFAEEAAKVLAAEGVIAYLFDRPSPVPLLSFAVRELKADAGIVITASHNTKEYNGFKVYNKSGCQMLPDETSIISSNMEALEDSLAIETMNMDDAIIDAKLIVPIGDAIIEKFMKAISACGLINKEAAEAISDASSDESKLKIVYTSLHGAGRDYVCDALSRAGFGNVILLEAQADFNGNFPTVEKPNPEDKKALELAVDKAYWLGADIVIGTDPDSDRVGVAVIKKSVAPGEPKAHYISGNQIAILLIDYLCNSNPEAEALAKPRRMISTIVSSAIGPIIAKKHGIETSLVLTGFKYIGDIMNRMEAAGWEEEFFLGYEESFGYLTGKHVRDKDGVSSALAISRMAAYHKARGKSLVDRLTEIYEEYGYCLDSQETFVFEGSAGEKIMDDIMLEFRKTKGELFENLFDDGEAEPSFTDFRDEDTGLPSSNVLKFTFANGSFVAIRPSGTEPKLKVYYCMMADDPLKPYDNQKLAAKRIHNLTDKYIKA